MDTSQEERETVPLVTPRGRPRWTGRGMGISLHRSHAVDAPEDSPNQTMRLKRELQGKNKAERYLSEGLLKRQKPEGRHLPKIPSAPSGMGVTRAAPQSSLTRAGEGADKAPSSHLNPALLAVFFLRRVKVRPRVSGVRICSHPIVPGILFF
jgi:hypothetical protein